MEKLLYSIGEIVAVCLDEVEEVIYPKLNNPSSFIIKTTDSNEYILKIDGNKEDQLAKAI